MSFAEVDAYVVGRITGQICLILLLLAGILKCITISKRPTTNSKCVWSLACFLAAFLVPAAINLIPKESPVFVPLTVMVKVFWIGLCFVASIILAILGLVECGREQGRFIQGRAQAIWALGLCGVFLFLSMTGAAVALMRAQNLQTLSASRGLLTFPDLNFQFSAPGRPWRQVNASKLNHDAKLAFTQAYPEMYFLVIAEPMGRLDFTTQTLADMAQMRIQSVADSYHVLEQKLIPIGRLNGLEIRTEAQVQGHSLFYVQWFCVTNGWAYQLTTFGKLDDENQVVDAAQQMMSGFALIDYQRRAPILGGESITDYVSANFGYRVHFADSYWIKWKKLEAECPFASFGVLHRQDAAFIVTAISLTGLKAEPEAIYRGFFGLVATTDVLKDAHEIKEQKLEGVETTFNQTVPSGKEFTYRLKVLRGGDFAYFVAAWVESQNPQKDEILGEAMSSVAFSGVPPAALGSATLSTGEKRAERMALNGIGKVYFSEQSYEQSADFFKRAVDLDGLQPGTTYLANLTTARIRDGNYRLALDELERHPEYVDSQPELAANRAFLQGQLGQIDLALTNYVKLFATGYNSADYFKDYIMLLAQTQQQARALDEVESYLKKEDSPEIRLVQAALLTHLKKFDEAITRLRAQHEKYPNDIGITVSLGDAFIQAGKPSEALSLSDEMLKQDRDSAAAWSLKGRAQFALKWFREAKESFNNVIAEAPSNTDARQFLQILSGILGEGSNVAAQDTIDPVVIPDELTNSIPKPADKFGRDEGAYYSRHVTVVAFKKGLEIETTEYQKVHIISSAGVSAFSTFQFVFNPLNEEIYVNQLIVKNAAGALVSTGSADNYYVLDYRDDGSSSSASSRKVLNIPVAGLQPGCDIELTVSHREVGQPNEFPFLACVFSGSFPIQEQDLCFIGETNLIRFDSAPELAPQALPHGLLWSETEPPVFRREPLQPSVVDYLSTVWLSDASTRWPDLVTNYLATIRDRLELPDDQKRLAQQMTSSATNLTQKIAAIADYVQTNYTYKAIEFGRRARVPQSMADFVQNKYGDCKDHAVLVQQMLKAAGVPAYLALLNTIEPVRENLPSLDQFNHMVVYIPSATDNQFLDCTAKTFDLSAGSFGLADRQALILDPTKPYFQKIPAYPTNASVVVLTRSIEITNQTGALVTETIQIKGIHAGLFREYFRNVTADSRRQAVAKQFVGDFGELKDFKIEGMDDPNSPLVINLTYLARRQFQILENEIAGSPPLNLERSFLLNQTVEKRTTPFQISIPLTMEGSVTIHVPASFKSKPAGPARNIQNQFVACRFSAITNETGWRLDYHIYEPANRFASEQYPAYSLAMQQVVNTLGPNLVCVRQ